MFAFFKRFRSKAVQPRNYLDELPPCVEIKERPWTGADSKTARDIRELLMTGPKTRAQISGMLDVQTASCHLPRMVKRGEIRIQPGSRPFIYELS